jgi:hypothetical protein
LNVAGGLLAAVYQGAALLCETIIASSASIMIMALGGMGAIGVCFLQICY